MKKLIKFAFYPFTLFFKLLFWFMAIITAATLFLMFFGVPILIVWAIAKLAWYINLKAAIANGTEEEFRAKPSFLGKVKNAAKSVFSKLQKLLSAAYKRALDKLQGE